MMDAQEAKRLALSEQDEFARRAKVFHDYMNSDSMKAVLLQRLQINDAASHNVEARAMTYELCKRDDNPAEGCIFFIENFGWTFDPRKEVKHIPFILFDFQKDAIREIIEHIDNGRDLFLEKSRDMGITWVTTWVFIWYWLFRDGSNLLMGSYKEKLVDDGTDDSLFGRLDVSIRSLPKWLWPKGYNPKKHRTKLKIVNPVNNNLLAGDTMNPDFGRGSRKTAIFFDELGFWDYAEDAWGTCLSEDHDILTNRGWIPVREVTTDDTVLSMDKDSGLTKYMPVEQKTKSYYEKMIHFKGKSIDSIVSPDHNMLYETKQGNRHLKPAEYVKDLKSGSFLIGNDGFVSTKEAPQWEAYTPEDFLEFLGWYISEGCICTSGGIKISQSSIVNPNKYLRIKNLLDRLRIKYSSRWDHFYIWKNTIPKDLWSELEALGKSKTKHIPEKYEGLPRQYSLALWQGLMLGDGYNVQRPGKANETGYITSSEKLADQVQRLLQELGFNSSKKWRPDGKTWNIQLKYKTRINLDKLEHEVIEWNDYAYCLTTPLSTIYVRRNGLAYWVGNCGDTTACRIANSTPNGQNFYADLRETGIDLFTMHWTSHPLKDDLWYAFECARRSEEEVAQEIDISYTKSQEGRVYKEWNEQNIIWGVHEYNPQLPLYVGWDFGKEDPTTIIWCQPENGKLNIIDAYTKNGENIDYFIPFVTGILPSEENLNYRYTKYDYELIESHKHWKRGVHFGDPAGRNRNQVNDATVLSVLREHGIVVNFKEQWKTFQNRKRAAKALIREGIHINTNDRTKKFAKCIDQASYPQVRREGQKEINSVKPKHDWTSHYRSAFEYLALGLEEFTNRRQPRDRAMPKKTDKRGRRRALSY